MSLADWPFPEPGTGLLSDADCAAMFMWRANDLTGAVLEPIAVALTEAAHPTGWQIDVRGPTNYIGSGYDPDDPDAMKPWFVRWTQDTGGWQLTTAAHVDKEPYPGMGQIPVSSCFDPVESTDRAIDVMRRTASTSWGYDLSRWTTWESGAHWTRHDRAIAARQEVLEFLQS